MSQTHTDPQRSREQEMADLADEAIAVQQSERAKEARKQLAVTDDLLDEIDALIEEAGDMATTYRQSGGQ